LKKTVIAVQNENSSLKSQIQQFAPHSTDFQIERHNLQDQIQILQDEFNFFKDQYFNLKNTVTTLQNENSSLKRQVQQLSQYPTDFQEEKRNLHNQIQILQKDKITFDQRCQYLEVKRKRAHRAIEGFREQISNLQLETTYLSTCNSQLIDENQKFQNRLQFYRQHHEK
jgi:chromosome segregation ATPase